jgi:hypothetical protein
MRALEMQTSCKMEGFMAECILLRWRRSFRVPHLVIMAKRGGRSFPCTMDRSRGLCRGWEEVSLFDLAMEAPAVSIGVMGG